MGRKRSVPSFETPRKRAAPQDDGRMCGSEKQEKARPVFRLGPLPLGQFDT
jgi:hypothetical protein